MSDAYQGPIGRQVCDRCGAITSRRPGTVIVAHNRQQGCCRVLCEGAFRPFTAGEWVAWWQEKEVAP